MDEEINSAFEFRGRASVVLGYIRQVAADGRVGCVPLTPQQQTAFIVSECDRLLAMIPVTA